MKMAPTLMDPNISRKKRLLIAVTGSVAAVKLPEIVNGIGKLKVGQEVEVRIVATDRSMHFFRRASVIPCVLYTDRHEWKMWQKMSDPVLHVELSKWADMLVIAPLDANTMAKIANGLCDNLLTCLVRAWDLSKPLFFAPAMNTAMYEHPVTKAQIEFLRALGYEELPAIEKKLACGDIGIGGMAAVSYIVERIGSKLKDMAVSVRLDKTIHNRILYPEREESYMIDDEPQGGGAYNRGHQQQRKRPHQQQPPRGAKLQPGQKMLPSAAEAYLPKAKPDAFLKKVRAEAAGALVGDGLLPPPVMLGIPDQRMANAPLDFRPPGGIGPVLPPHPQPVPPITTIIESTAAPPVSMRMVPPPVPPVPSVGPGEDWGTQLHPPPVSSAAGPYPTCPLPTTSEPPPDPANAASLESANIPDLAKLPPNLRLAVEDVLTEKAGTRAAANTYKVNRNMIQTIVTDVKRQAAEGKRPGEIEINNDKLITAATEKERKQQLQQSGGDHDYVAPPGAPPPGLETFTGPPPDVTKPPPDMSRPPPPVSAAMDQPPPPFIEQSRLPPPPLAGPPPPFGQNVPPPMLIDQGGPPLPFVDQGGLPPPFADQAGLPPPFADQAGPPPPFVDQGGPPPPFIDQGGQPPPVFIDPHVPPPGFEEHLSPVAHYSQPPPVFSNQEPGIDAMAGSHMPMPPRSQAGMMPPPLMGGMPDLDGGMPPGHPLQRYVPMEVQHQQGGSGGMPMGPGMAHPSNHLQQESYDGGAYMDDDWPEQQQRQQLPPPMMVRGRPRSAVGPPGMGGSLRKLRQQPGSARERNVTKVPTTHGLNLAALNVAANGQPGVSFRLLQRALKTARGMSRQQQQQQTQAPDTSSPADEGSSDTPPTSQPPPIKVVVGSGGMKVGPGGVKTRKIIVKSIGGLSKPSSSGESGGANTMARVGNNGAAEKEGGDGVESGGAGGQRKPQHRLILTDGGRPAAAAANSLGILRGPNPAPGLLGESPGLRMIQPGGPNGPGVGQGATSDSPVPLMSVDTLAPLPPNKRRIVHM